MEITTPVEMQVKLPGLPLRIAEHHERQLRIDVEEDVVCCTLIQMSYPTRKILSTDPVDLTGFGGSPVLFVLRPVEDSLPK